MAPKENSIKKFGVERKQKKSKGRSMPINKFVRSVRSGHLMMSFSF